MGKTYRQLTLEERNTIARLRIGGESIRQIAAIMDRSASTISREIKRNIGGKQAYMPAYADEKTWARRWRGSRLARQPALLKYVLDRLAMGWSPQQISCRMTQDEHSMRISHESIYRFIYAEYARTKNGAWRLYLPRAKFKRGFRGRRGGHVTKTIKHRVSISERPQHIESREEIGHWETDLMMFSDKKHNLLVAQERKSRFVMIEFQENKKAQNVVDIQKEWFTQLPAEMRKTCAMDNGTEFSLHYQMNDELQMQTYFCNPHSPWQKGGVENMNGRLRRYLPLNTDIKTLSKENIDMIALRMNTTPRKCLDYKTPLEVFSQQLLHFKCESTYRSTAA